MGKNAEEIADGIVKMLNDSELNPEQMLEVLQLARAKFNKMKEGRTKERVGVAIDQWKFRHYKRAIEQKGFEIENTFPDDGSGFALIQVLCDSKEKVRLGLLLKNLERKYSQRNKMN